LQDENVAREWRSTIASCPVPCELKQITDTDTNNPLEKFRSATDAIDGYLFILVLQEGTKIDPEWIKVIKQLWLKDFFDFHNINISNNEALLSAPIFCGTYPYNKGCSFKWDGQNFVQDFDAKYVENFMKIVNER